MYRVSSPGRPPIKVLDCDSRSVGTSAPSLRPDCPSTSSRVWFPETVTRISWLSPSHSGAGQLAMTTSPALTRTYWKHRKCQHHFQDLTNVTKKHTFWDLKCSHLAIRLCLDDSQPERWRERPCPGGQVRRALRWQTSDGESSGHSGSVILTWWKQEVTAHIVPYINKRGSHLWFYQH